MDNERQVTATDSIKIVGILLVRNEDQFIERIIRNIIDFCDEVLVADNKSTDRTAEIVLSLRERFPKIHYSSIDHPAKSQKLISGYAGTATWIFAVDGDELYDPLGLAILRQRIRKGEFDATWMMLGNVMNCLELDQDAGQAKGYLSPPCRSMTKLYNFNLISDWSGDCPERLHGGKIRFKDRASAEKRLELHTIFSWEDSIFRCLHLCFLQRSSKDRPGGDAPVLRKNISDRNSEGIFKRILMAGMSLLGLRNESFWKNEKYMRGDLVQKDVSSFFGCKITSKL